MSNYSQIIAYGPKDSLALNDPNKFIKGTQFDGEFQAIATAIATKQDTPLKNLGITGDNNVYAVTASGSTTSGQSLGLQVFGGSNSADTAFSVNRSGTSVLFFRIRGDGALLCGTGSTDMTATNGSFTGTLNGVAGTVNTTVTWYKIGSIVTMFLPTVSATSNSTSFFVAGVPSNLQMVTAATTNSISNVVDNGANQSGGSVALFTSSPNLVISRPSGNWTASGTKGYTAFNFTYIIV